MGNLIKLFINKEKIKKFAPDYQFTEEFFQALDREVQLLLCKALARCSQNNRKRVVAYDL